MSTSPRMAPHVLILIDCGAHGAGHWAQRKTAAKHTKLMSPEGSAVAPHASHVAINDTWRFASARVMRDGVRNTYVIYFPTSRQTQTLP